MLQLLLASLTLPVIFLAREAALEENAKTWLWVTAGLAIATVVASIVSFFLPLPQDSGNAGLAQFFTSKIVLLGVLIMATVWCGCIYKAIKHQAAINAHKANALKSFQAFVNATADEATKNAVLLETTRSIFALGTSGYLDQSDGVVDSGTKVIANYN
ncbi:FtsH-binding integral membrane protein [Polynucleobacter sphagniphilus]|nr:FtsH-binding integral membrane protein [Polynucleobacter sphagniphilus]